MIAVIFCLSASRVFGFDFETFAKTELFRCIHPTVRSESAKAVMIGKIACEGGITKAKVKIDYQGWIRQNSMLIEISLKDTSPRMLRAAILNDSTGTGRTHLIIQPCAYTEGWQEIPD